jgi:glutamate---cysteine ligase / carboxylate-amine ligase
MIAPRSFGLFRRFGVELEYMIVDSATLNARPISDELIRDVTGSVDGDVTRGHLSWSNELALHVIELKTNRPATTLVGLADAFHRDVTFINRHLARSGARLLPTAMHPWMNPMRESRLWPHGNGEIYAAFHRIFNCQGHGWTNLQSTHLNLPFATDQEFARLHAAIRVLLPLLPALAASSPFVDGTTAPNLDQRLEAYRRNCRRIPSVTGRVIPEPVTSPQEYQRAILQRIYQDLAPHDPNGILRHEWANARGAIARFDRHTIEIRILDVQECPAADLALVQFISALLRKMTAGPRAERDAQNAMNTVALERLLMTVIRSGLQTPINSRAYRDLFGLPERGVLTALDFWRHQLERCATSRTTWRPFIELLLREGSLAERLRRAAGHRPSPATLRILYRQLADCLARNTPFLPSHAGKPVG